MSDIFECGNVADLKNKMEVSLDKGLSEIECEKTRRQIKEKYNWNSIAE